MLIDLQTHGETPGKRITFGLRKWVDIEATVAFLCKTFPSERIAAIGVSLGAAAVVLAKHALQLDAAVHESLHSTIEEMVVSLSGREYAPVLLPQLAFYPDPITRIGDLNAPLLLIAGSTDEHTKVPETERLFAAAQQPKDIWIVPGAGHFNMHSYAGKEYEMRISEFLDQHLH